MLLWMPYGRSRKFLHEEEMKQFESIAVHAKRETFLASRWAAKEAAYKAFSKWRIPFPDLKVSKSERGNPVLMFEGMAKQISLEMDLGEPLLSISHDTEYATATVILQRKQPSL